MIKKRLKNKLGISELVSYILLITLSIAIAAGTYVWLKSIAVQPETVECPDVSFWMVNYTCLGRSFDNMGQPTTGGELDFFLENKGRIDVDGFRIQISDKAIDPIFKDIYITNTYCKQSNMNTFLCRINASQTVEVFGTLNLRTVKLVRVTPMKRVDSKDAYCKSIDFQIDDCVEGAGGIPQ